MKKKISVNKWSFDNMPESYDSHLKRSIPLYQESQFFISKISSYFIKDQNNLTTEYQIKVFDTSTTEFLYFKDNN